jgi:hypothetical protein
MWLFRATGESLQGPRVLCITELSDDVGGEKKNAINITDVYVQYASKHTSNIHVHDV